MRGERLLETIHSEDREVSRSPGNSHCRPRSFEGEWRVRGADGN